MPWIKVDDHFDEHPKFARAGPLGIALWLAGLAYSNRNLTDGFIPWSTARSLLTWEFLRRHPEDDREMVWTVDTGTGMHGQQVTCEFVIELLVDAGLWEEVAGGYKVHDFDDYQPTRAEVLEERRKAAERQALSRAQRESRRESQAKSRHESRQKSGVSSGAPVPVPVPVPEPESALSPGARDGTSEDDPIWAYHQLTARSPSKGAMDWLDRLGREYGDERVSQAMGAEWQRDSDLRTLLSRVEAGLAAASRRASQAADAKRRRAAIDEQQALAERIEAATPEERARAEAIAAEIRQGLAAVGKAMP